MTPGIYRHYKGGLYVVVGVVRDSTNGPSEGREMVLYYSPTKRLWHVRVVWQFMENVTQGNTTVPRFRLMEDSG